MLPTENRLIGKMNYGIDRIYPDLEDLEVTPTGEEQKFKSEKYGYNEVTVHAVESEELNIMPSTEEQEYIGMYKKVTVVGEPNLAPENIVQDKEIFGVKGSAKVADFVITDGYYLCAYNKRIEIAQELVNMCGAITSANRMFASSAKLAEIDLSKLDTSQCTNMSYMLENCIFTSLDLSNFDMSKVIDISYFLDYSSRLTTIKSFKNLGKGYTQKSTNYSNYKLNLSYCNKLTYESLVDIITNGLYDLNLTYDVANGGTLYTQTLELGSTNLAKLTEQEIAIATAKRLDCFIERRNNYGIKRTNSNT